MAPVDMILLSVYFARFTSWFSWLEETSVPAQVRKPSNMRKPVVVATVVTAGESGQREP
jgi:hypothetical protein